MLGACCKGAVLHEQRFAASLGSWPPQRPGKLVEALLSGGGMLDHRPPRHTRTGALLVGVGFIAVAVVMGLPLLSYRSVTAVTATQHQVRAARAGASGSCGFGRGAGASGRAPHAPAAVLRQRGSWTGGWLLLLAAAGDRH